MFCTINPTKFRFEISFPLLPWSHGRVVELDCCCLEDGLQMLRSQGVNPLNVTGVEFWTGSQWQRFRPESLDEIRAIAIAQQPLSA